MGTPRACFTGPTIVSRPRLSGSERSNNTTSKRSVSSIRRASERRSAFARSAWNTPASLRYSRTKRASPGLSSTSRILSVSGAMASMLPWELDHCEPEVLDGLHHLRELVQVHRFCDVGVRMVVVAPDDVLFRGGSRQDDHGNLFEVGILLDFGQHFAPILSRHVQIEQDEIGARCSTEIGLLTQISHRLDSVVDDVYAVTDLALLQKLHCQAHIAGVVLDEQDFDWLSGSLPVHGYPLLLSGIVKKKAEPRPGSDSTQIRPPCLSTIFLQTARPMPVPGYSSRRWSRWNMTKSRSKYFGSMPIPLSLTENVHSRPFFFAAMWTLGFFVPWNLIALPTRFRKTCAS